MVDSATRKSLSSIPLLKTKAGPRDKDQWPLRLKEELQALIEVMALLLLKTEHKTYFAFPFMGLL